MLDIYVNYKFVVVPPSFTETPVNQTVKEGDNTTFHCTANGNPVPNIKWIKDGMAVGTGDTLTFETNRNHSGKYWCTAENGLDVQINASTLLNVQCKYTEAYHCELEEQFVFHLIPPHYESGFHLTVEK